MVAVKLDGGLGNQMFQYAFIKSVGTFFEVPYAADVSAYQQVPQRAALLLPSLNVPKQYFCNNQSLLYHINLLRVLKKAGIKRFGKATIEIENVFQPLQRIGKPRGIYYGYFQFHRYFDNLYQELQNELRFEKVYASAYYKEILATESIGLHIRRGDYITNQRAARLMADISIDYYCKAVDDIISNGNGNEVLFLFSNDMDWVKDTILPFFQSRLRSVMVNHANFLSQAGLFDFECMKKCKHNIIANSTFSWWAAYLNPNKGKRVIAPEYWYAAGPLKQQDFYPLEWAIIPN
jgi:hypothetical protein